MGRGISRSQQTPQQTPPSARSFHPHQPAPALPNSSLPQIRISPISSPGSTRNGLKKALGGTVEVRGAARIPVTPRAGMRGRGGRGGRLRRAGLGAAAVSWQGLSGKDGGSSSYSLCYFLKDHKSLYLEASSPQRGLCPDTVGKLGDDSSPSYHPLLTFWHGKISRHSGDSSCARNGFKSLVT